MENPVLRVGIFLAALLIVFLAGLGIGAASGVAARGGETHASPMPSSSEHPHVGMTGP